MNKLYRVIALIGSEIIHALFLNAPFDIWDMVTSALAALCLVIIHSARYIL